MTVHDPPLAAPRPAYGRYVYESLRFVVRWLAIYPVLGGTAALLAGIIAFDLLAAFGIPALFWRQPWPKMLLIGASLAIVFALCSFAGFLLESKKETIRPRAYFRRTFPLLTLFVLLGAYRFKYEPGTRTVYAHAWVMVAGYLLGFAFVLFMSFIVLPMLWRWVNGAMTQRAIKFATGAGPDDIPLHGYATLVFALAALTYVVLAIALPNWLPSAVAFCILFAVLVLAYGFVRFTLPSFSFAIFVLAILLTGFVNAHSPYKHRYPWFGAAAYDNPVVIPRDGGAPNPSLIPNDAAFTAWQHRASSKVAPKPRLVVIATSGGGIRAAVWTGSVLNELSEKIDHFSRHVRILTGASGGMVGAAFYAANVHQDAKLAAFSAMAKDSLEPVARSLALRDLPSLVLPGSIPDRGVALEEAWIRNAPVLKAHYATLEQGEREGWRPSLIFTPMFVEDGRRTVISNLDLRFLTENRAPDETLYSRSAVELFRILPAARTDLPIASIARMNASFPYVSTASELPVTPRRHVVDAGYYDNYGVEVSVAWLAHNFDRIVRETSGVALIQIRDTEQQAGFIHADSPRKPSFALDGYSEFLAPILGALQARNSIMILRNDADVQQLALAFCERTNDAEFFRTFVIENTEDAALSWSLTDGETDRMLGYFDNPDNRYKDGVRAVDALQQWWVRRPPPAPTAALAANTAVLP